MVLLLDPRRIRNGSKFWTNRFARLSLTWPFWMDRTIRNGTRGLFIFQPNDLIVSVGWSMRDFGSMAIDRVMADVCLSTLETSMKDRTFRIYDKDRVRSIIGRMGDDSLAFTRKTNVMGLVYSPIPMVTFTMETLNMDNDPALEPLHFTTIRVNITANGNRATTTERGF
eukprot:scaffold5267_cov90-Cylindrotheca_fusiformis.AAC.4